MKTVDKMKRTRKREKESHTLIRISTFILISVVFGLIYFLILQYNYKDQGDSYGLDHNMMKKQYNDILRRAASLSSQYKNITGKTPPIAEGEGSLRSKNGVLHASNGGGNYLLFMRFFFF